MTREETLRVALRNLMAEAMAMLAIAEPEMREAAGHTNVNVLRLRVDEAAEALASQDSAAEQEEG